MSENNKTWESVVAYKGFNSDWTCRGFQYEIGKTYTHDGEVVRCASGGFHSCEYPLDVFGYYAPASSKFAVVAASGQIDRDDEDTKIASGRITIEAEIAIPSLVARAIEWITERCDVKKSAHTKADQSASSATGGRSASSATGYQSASSATGDQSASSATGDQSASSATGDWSASSATGDWSASSATGDQSASSATGYQSASSATGYQSASSATGVAAVALNIGQQGKARASEGGAICLCNHSENGELRHIRASKVGDNGIKPDVFYMLNDDGEFVEVEE